MTTTIPQVMLTTHDQQFTDIVSASTVSLDSAVGNYGQITGTTTITAITLSAGKVATVRFTGALTLTNGASLVLPGGVNITTAAGDVATFANIGGTVYCTSYVPIANKAQSGAVKFFHQLLNSRATSTGLVCCFIHGLRCR